MSDIKDIDENGKEIILIGNKIDVNDKRVIYKREAKEKADKYNIKYIELCCLNGLNIYELLNEAILGGYYKYYENEKKGTNLNRKDSIKINNKHKDDKDGNNHRMGCC